ncbi:protein-tyrosine phosphatase family protein [Geodermatophilus sp. SYSU D00758]
MDGPEDAALHGADGPWDAALPGVLELPSGRRVRGRALREPTGGPVALGVYLAGRPVTGPAAESLWVRWRDFALPADPAALREALRAAWERSAAERVEIACHGGTGRTGTALACLAVLDGVPAQDAVAFVRARYRRRAVETPWQRALVARFVP